MTRLRLDTGKEGESVHYPAGGSVDMLVEMANIVQDSPAGTMCGVS